MITSKQAIARWQAAPDNQKFYCDGSDHENPAAELAFRSAYSSAVQEAANLSKKQVERLFADAQRARLKARRAAGSGPYVDLFVAGHEVMAAQTRGRSHGLHAVLMAIESGATPARICSSVSELIAWAQSDCTVVIGPPDISVRLACPTCSRTKFAPISNTGKHRCLHCGWLIRIEDEKAVDAIAWTTAGKRVKR